jgi:serine/threonine protein kinase
VRIATSVCEALYYAYNEPDSSGVVRRVVHCDVSPSNVLVGYDGQVKLADFGIATVIEDGGTARSGTINGKCGYLTPEQIRCEPLDQRSDVFSLGTMLWEMALGRQLFQRDTEIEMLNAVLEEPIPRPSELVPAFPLDLERVICKALARPRDDRYPDAHALADDLRAIARDHQWSCEKSALSQLVKDSLPDDQIAFAGIGSDPDSDRPWRVTTGGWVGSGSFAAVSVIDAAGPDALGLRDRAWWARSVPATLAILVVLSVVFWLWIVPMIDPGPLALPLR